MKRILIAGGGIAGLSIAYEIRKRRPAAEVVILEKSDRPGGNIRTEVVDGYTCEWGPDGFLDNAPRTLALVSDLGLGPRLLPSADAARRRFIYRAGRLHEVPTSPGAFLRSELLSFRGKARIAWEPFARRRPETDETIFEFAARRIGAEAASTLIDPMVSGIFAGDARALSLRACFPKMWQMESDHGGLFRALFAMRRSRRKDDALGAPAGRLTSFHGGMEDLVRALAATLHDALRTASPVLELRTSGQAFPPRSRAFSACTRDGQFDADAVVLAGPAADASALVYPFDSTLGGLLARIETAPLAVVCLGYDAAEVTADRGPLNGFGFLVPRSEDIRTLGALWETSIYPHRAPDGKALIRVMIGGARDPRAVDLNDAAMLQIVRADLQRTMGLKVAPEFLRIIRHRRGIPQYNREHLARLQRIDTLLQAHPGLFLAGNSYRGVAMNACIADAQPIADRVLEFLQQPARAKSPVRSPAL